MKSISEQIAERWKHLSKSLGQTKSEYRDEQMDNELVSSAKKAMEEKREIARQKGRGGWWTEDCQTEQLKAMLDEHIAKGDMRDVMNIAAMIYYRESAGIGE